jgi:hypothetical protein
MVFPRFFPAIDAATAAVDGIGFDAGQRDAFSA